MESCVSAMVALNNPNHKDFDKIPILLKYFLLTHVKKSMKISVTLSVTISVPLSPTIFVSVTFNLCIEHYHAPQVNFLHVPIFGDQQLQGVRVSYY